MKRRQRRRRRRRSTGGSPPARQDGDPELHTLLGNDNTTRVAGTSMPDGAKTVATHLEAAVARLTRRRSRGLRSRSADRDPEPDRRGASDTDRSRHTAARDVSAGASSNRVARQESNRASGRPEVQEVLSSLDYIQTHYDDVWKTATEDKNFRTYARRLHAQVKAATDEAQDLVEEISAAGIRGMVGDVESILHDATVSYVAGLVPVVGQVAGPVTGVAISHQGLHEARAEAGRAVAYAGAAFKWLREVRDGGAQALMGALTDEDSLLVQLRNHEDDAEDIFTRGASARSRIEQARASLRVGGDREDVRQAWELVQEYGAHVKAVNQLTSRIEASLARSARRWKRLVPEARRAFIARAAEQGEAGARQKIFLEAEVPPAVSPRTSLRLRGNITTVGDVTPDKLGESVEEHLRSVPIGQMHRKFGVPVLRLDASWHSAADLFWNRSSGVGRLTHNWKQLFWILNGRSADGEGDKDTLDRQLESIGLTLADKTVTELQGGVEVRLDA